MVVDAVHDRGEAFADILDIGPGPQSGVHRSKTGAGEAVVPVIRIKWEKMNGGVAWGYGAKKHGKMS